MVDEKVTHSHSRFSLGIKFPGIGWQVELSHKDMEAVSILRYQLFHRKLSSPVKNIEMIRDCRVLLRGLLFFIGASLLVFNYQVMRSDMLAVYFFWPTCRDL